MAFKIFLNGDPETGKGNAFMWTEGHEPPPVIRPRKPEEPKDVPPAREARKEEGN
jgi:hypothetical protein